MLIAADAAPSSTSPVLGNAFIIGLTALSWFGLWRYARPALRSQDGRADRMSRDRRLRRIAWTMLIMIYPLMFTAGCLFIVFTPTSSAANWPATIVIWSVYATPVVAALLGVAALTFRTIDRHHVRAQHRALGLPDPPAPWWPSAVVATWTTIAVGVTVAAGYLAWQLFAGYAERRSALIQSQGQTALNDHDVQQMIANGAPKGAVQDRIAALTGTDDDIAALKATIHTFMVGYLIAILVILVVIIVGAVLLYRRQKRRRTDYDVRITESVARAAQLAI